MCFMTVKGVMTAADIQASPEQCSHPGALHICDYIKCACRGTSTFTGGQAGALVLLAGAD